MKLKIAELNGKTYAEVLEGKPLFVADDGKEIAVDVPHTTATISRLNAEAKSHRERAEAAEKSLKAFEGIEDPSAARKAIEDMANIDAGKMVAAGKVEEIKEAAKKAAEAQVAAGIKQHVEKLAQTSEKLLATERELYAEKIGGSFGRSKFIAEKTAISVRPMQAIFGHFFKVEEGKIVAYDASGNKITSKIKFGELADFDEALEMLVDQYPDRDQILKGANHSGSGARPANGGLARIDMSKMSPVERMNAARAAVR